MLNYIAVLISHYCFHDLLIVIDHASLTRNCYLLKLNGRWKLSPSPFPIKLIASITSSCVLLTVFWTVLNLDFNGSRTVANQLSDFILFIPPSPIFVFLRLLKVFVHILGVDAPKSQKLLWNFWSLNLCIDILYESHYVFRLFRRVIWMILSIPMNIRFK